MKIVLPAQNVPIQPPSGGIDPTWYEKLTAMQAFVNLFSEIDFNNFPNNYTLVWNATTKKFVAGAN
jgi:hypothetical protein